MKRFRSFLIIIITALVLSACSSSKSNDVDSPSASPTSTADPAAPSDTASTDPSGSPQTSLFVEVKSGGSIIQSYTFNDKLENAVFRKHTSLPYGVYVPEFMDQREFSEGVEWGYGEPRNSFAIMDGSLIQPEFQQTEPDLATYKEYVGTDRSDPKMEYDYFSFHGESHELIIRFAYTIEEKAEALKLFLAMITSLRETHSNEDFKAGVFLTYDESSLDETQKAVLQCAMASMDAIIARDAKSFAKTLESQAIADALSFLIDDGNLYRFEELESITALDEKRYNVNVVYKRLSEESFLFNSSYAFTVRKNKDGEWKVANID
ncbi:hypothetical protein [Cohnella soli]|uniref:Uncharacterized protein n=1 Tax=Cohnella soli TaxID=425005 RepID=A0ABW0HK86_9BACL